MPALPDYPNVLRVRLGFTKGAAVDIGTSLHFLYTGTAPTDATCVTLATDILGYAATQFVDLMDGDTSLINCTVTDLTSPTAGYGEHASTTAGTRGGGILGANDCVVVSYGILRRYRGGKPRSYWPFGSETDILDPQDWDSTLLTDVETKLGNFFADINVVLIVDGCAVGATCSVSYYEGFTAVENPITGRWRNVPKVRAAAIAPDTIAGLVVKQRIGSQRRRLGR